MRPLHSPLPAQFGTRERLSPDEHTQHDDHRQHGHEPTRHDILPLTLPAWCECIGLATLPTDVSGTADCSENAEFAPSYPRLTSDQHEAEKLSGLDEIGVVSPDRPRL
jgi:hypothetical protein